MIAPDEIWRLWKTHSAALELFARARSRSPEDCVQEAFIKLSRQPEMPRDAMAWLVRAVRNQAIDIARTTERRVNREREFAELRRLWFQAGSDGGHLALAAEVQAGLMQLEVEDIELITAHIWNGLSFRQLAELFDQPSSTLHRRYLAALTKLRSHLLEKQT